MLSGGSTAFRCLLNSKRRSSSPASKVTATSLRKKVHSHPFTPHSVISNFSCSSVLLSAVSSDGCRLFFVCKVYQRRSVIRSRSFRSFSFFLSWTSSFLASKKPELATAISTRLIRVQLSPPATRFHPEAVLQVIRHGNACHAYMDIEFQMSINSGLHGDCMTRARCGPLYAPEIVILTHLTVNHLIICAVYGKNLRVCRVSSTFLCDASKHH